VTFNYNKSLDLLAFPKIFLILFLLKSLPFSVENGSENQTLCGTGNILFAIGLKIQIKKKQSPRFLLKYF